MVSAAQLWLLPITRMILFSSRCLTLDLGLLVWWFSYNHPTLSICVMGSCMQTTTDILRILDLVLRAEGGTPAMDDDASIGAVKLRHRCKLSDLSILP